MYPTQQDPLLRLMAAYHAAVIREEGLSARLRQASGDPELLDRSLAAAENVIKARAELRAGLIGLGWTPPPEVAQDLTFDVDVLQLPGT